MDRGTSLARWLTTLALVACGLAAGRAGSANACTCRWAGPFLAVQADAPVLLRAKVLAHAGKGRHSGQPLAMDLEVLEVLRGPAPGRDRLRVWGDDGHLCRPYVTRFPVGSEWILALNGPGSKPGMSPGPSISACGEYWLEVRGDSVVGNLDAPEMGGPSRRIPLAELRRLLASGPGGTGPAAPDDAGATRSQASFGFEVRAGESFERPFGPGFVIRLLPTRFGWRIAVTEPGRDEDLSRLTPPLHFAPNPRELEGWHFRNADNTGPNEPGEKNVNAPGVLREFVFSPEVGRTIQGPGARSGPTPGEVEEVRGFGEGRLTILDYRLTEAGAGEQAALTWMRGTVDLRWRTRSGRRP